MFDLQTLNELNGGKSGCMMWPGSNFDYEEVKCTYTQQFSANVSFVERVDTLIKWITDNKNPANLVMFYIEEPDTFAHAFGVTSEKVTDFVKRLNIVTEYLHHKLMENSLLNRTSVVHVSDHGMADLQISNIIDLTNFIGNNTCEFYGTTPVLQVVPKKGKNRDIQYSSQLIFQISLKWFEHKKSISQLNKLSKVINSHEVKIQTFIILYDKP